MNKNIGSDLKSKVKVRKLWRRLIKYQQGLGVQNRLTFLPNTPDTSTPIRSQLHTHVLTQTPKTRTHTHTQTHHTWSRLREPYFPISAPGDVRPLQPTENKSQTGVQVRLLRPEEGTEKIRIKETLTDSRRDGSGVPVVNDSVSRSPRIHWRETGTGPGDKEVGKWWRRRSRSGPEVGFRGYQLETMTNP